MRTWQNMFDPDWNWTSHYGLASYFQCLRSRDHPALRDCTVNQRDLTQRKIVQPYYNYSTLSFYSPKQKLFQVLLIEPQPQIGLREQHLNTVIQGVWERLKGSNCSPTINNQPEIDKPKRNEVLYWYKNTILSGQHVALAWSSTKCLKRIRRFYNLVFPESSTLRAFWHRLMWIFQTRCGILSGIKIYPSVVNSWC